MRPLAAAALLAAMWPNEAHCAGAEPFNFLFMDSNARATGLGGAYTALAADANALWYNPAGLARVRRYEATFMHNEHVEGITQEFVGFAAPKAGALR